MTEVPPAMETLRVRLPATEVDALGDLAFTLNVSLTELGRAMVRYATEHQGAFWEWVEKHDRAPVTPLDTLAEPESNADTEAVTCSECGTARPRDAQDYNPIQALTGAALGWYSGDDGEFCGGCMSSLIRRANDRG